jgi:hypothetical protein
VNQSPEERIAALLRALPDPPEAWTRAAIELPALRRTLDTIVGRAEEDRAFRLALVADLERALAAAGYELDRRGRAELAARLRGWSGDGAGAGEPGGRQAT